MDEIGEEDVQAMVANILTNQDSCEKVTIVASRLSAPIPLHLLSAYPTSTANWVSSVVTLDPAYFYPILALESFLGVMQDAEADGGDGDGEGGDGEDPCAIPEEGDSNLRMLKKEKKPKKPKKPKAPKPSKECKATWDKDDYMNFFDEIEDALTKDEFKAFWKSFKQAKKEFEPKKFFKYGDNWKTVASDLFCEAYPELGLSFCTSPAFWQALSDWEYFAQNNGLNYVFGKDEGWQTEYSRVCPDGATEAWCALLANFVESISTQTWN